MIVPEQNVPPLIERTIKLILPSKLPPLPIPQPAWLHLDNRFGSALKLLHPAGAALLQSPTGRSLLGALLTEPESEAVFRQVLHALLVVLRRYAEQREISAGTRRKQPISSDNDAVLQIARAAVGKFERRRLVRFRPTDAR